MVESTMGGGEHGSKGGEEPLRWRPEQQVVGRDVVGCSCCKFNVLDTRRGIGKNHWDI